MMLNKMINILIHYLTVFRYIIKYFQNLGFCFGYTNFEI